MKKHWVTGVHTEWFTDDESERFPIRFFITNEGDWWVLASDIHAALKTDAAIKKRIIERYKYVAQTIYSKNFELWPADYLSVYSTVDADLIPEELRDDFKDIKRYATFRAWMRDRAHIVWKTYRAGPRRKRKKSQ